MSCIRAIHAVTWEDTHTCRADERRGEVGEETDDLTEKREKEQESKRTEEMERSQKRMVDRPTSGCDSRQSSGT
jgi:hypothetical protein